jgi:hypothetical protein
MAILSGLGVTVVIVVLAATGEISVGVAVASFFVGLPLIEGAVYLLTMATNLVIVTAARLLDGDVVADWLDGQEGLSY